MSTNMRIDKVCELCGREFIAKTTVTRYCGDACAKRAYKQRQRIKKIAESDIDNDQVIRNRRTNERDKYSERAVLSINQTTEYLGVSRMTVYRMMKSGEIPFTKLGGRVLILKNQLDQKLGL
jgi:excisionase family DNA binding protein